VWRLFYDTIKGGDFRAREANVYRLAEVSVNIIDQCVAQGVPFAREYGGLLDNRSFGGAQVSRTFYARGQTGQQLLLGAYSALCKEIAAGSVQSFTHCEMLDLVVVDGHAKGIIVRDLITGEISRHSADAVVLATGGYGNVFNLSTNARNSNATAIWRAYKRGACFANPCFTQIHPTCIPVSGDYQSKLTLMSESLRNDGRIWVPKRKEDCRKDPNSIPEEDRDYYLERLYPTYGNLAPRDIASRAAKRVCDEGPRGGRIRAGGVPGFRRRHQAPGRGQDSRAVRQPVRHLQGDHRRGRLPHAHGAFTRRSITPWAAFWVDYNLMSNLPGLFVLGEANFSDHGANRLGASALMQGLADGYFVLPATIANYLATLKPGTRPSPDHPAFREAEENVRGIIRRLLSIRGRRSVQSFHKELGQILWEYCGMSRNEAGLKQALQRIPALREEFWHNLNLPGTDTELNQSLEKAGRVADYLELAELMCLDALERRESCGGHFREEYQYPDGEAKRDDEHFAHVAAWEYQGPDRPPRRNVEPLVFEEVQMTTRSYK
jgi:succinate dehydrogenase / fumarate reductase flavoprotein subunit